MSTEITHSPARINIFHTFGVTPGEINLSITNKYKSLLYLPQFLIIRDQDYMPVAKAKLHNTDASETGISLTTAGLYSLKPNTTAHFNILLEAKNITHLATGSEYAFCLQMETTPCFAWSDQILQHLDKFIAYTQDRIETPELNYAYSQILRAPFEHLETIPFNLKPLNARKVTLCMDFGTSYSVCAAFIAANMAGDLPTSSDLEPGKINHCKFKDNANEWKKLEPTKILLKKYDPQTQDIIWAFGYEAEKLAAAHPGEASYLTGIKAMLGDLEHRKICRDLEGNSVTLSYRDILTAYLRHLADTSRKFFGIDFRSIHVSTPVLYTDRQRNAYEQILHDIGFTEIQASLDEAKSPLYHFLSEYLRGYQRCVIDRPEPENISYFVVDCGGGSTDAMHFKQITLSHADDGTDAVKLEFSEPKVVGNPFFGGQRLTLFLFKYLKMLICLTHDKSLEPGKYLIDQLLDYQEADVFYQLNEKEEQIKLANKRDDIARIQMEMYKDFEATYLEQETLLPTHFSNYQSESINTYKQVEYNYNLLWLLAEQLKTRIYADDAPRTFQLSDLPEWNDNKGFWIGGKLIKEATLSGISISRYEVDKLYRPVIFIEISRLFRNLNLTSETFVSDIKNKRPYSRFVGQTTRIPLFDEALGYHIPRKVIEKSKKDETDQRFRDLSAETKKLCTVSGVAQYLQDVRTGTVVEDNFSQNEILLFDICLFDQNEKNEYGEYVIKKELIKRDIHVNHAQAWYIRTQASSSEDFIGYKYEEHKMPLGTVEFDQDNITRNLDETEAANLHTHSNEMSTRLVDNRNMLIHLSIKQVDYAQKLIFTPYIIKNGVYKTTHEPVEINFQSDHISLNAVNDYVINGV